MGLVITVGVDKDPKLIDPHDVAEDIVSLYNEWARANGESTVAFIAAEWNT